MRSEERGARREEGGKRTERERRKKGPCHKADPEPGSKRPDASVSRSPSQRVTDGGREGGNYSDGGRSFKYAGREKGAGYDVSTLAWTGFILNVGINRP